MIISHKHKYILLRVPKTGSTSLEASVRFCGGVDKDDICSKTDDANLPIQNIPLSYREDCRVHSRILSFAKEKKHLKLKLTKQENNILNFPHKWMLFFEHNTLDDLFKIPYYSKLKLINEDQVKQYKTYGFFRDPLERYLSSFVFYQVWSGRTQRKSNEISKNSFHYFTLNKLKTHNNILFRPQVDYFYFKGKQIVEPLMFDNWEEEASRMIKEIGFSPLKVYPRFKENGDTRKKFPNGKPKVTEWIDPYPKIKEIITEHFLGDIEFQKKIANK